MFRTASLAFILCALSACSASNDSNETDGDVPSTEPSAPLPEADAAKLQQTLDAVVRAGIAPGVSVVVSRPGYLPWFGTSGIADRDTSAPLTAASRFRAGSNLKTAVATAVLRLVERGTLSLDAPLTTVLPEDIAVRVTSADTITLRMLLNHTSGIPDFDTPDFDGAVAAAPTHVWSNEELFARAFALPPVFAPGAGWSYSNTNYVLAGVVLEQATGKSWREVVRDEVFLPGGMTDSFLPENGNPLCDGCARGYQTFDAQSVDVTEIDPSMAGPAGGDAWITTPGDFAKLLGGLESGKFFEQPSTFALMSDFVDAPDPELAQTGYGLGFAHFALGNLEFDGNLGGTAGFQSFNWREVTTGTIVSGYMNAFGDFASFVVPFVTTLGETLGLEQADSAE